MTVLRIYLPSECDASGELLDWERCRTCEGEGWASRPLGLPRDKHTATQTCPTCDGHGSLRAAALAALAHNHPGEPFSTQGYALDGMVVRCEDCGHPMSEGTWEEVTPDDFNLLALGDPQANTWVTSESSPFTFGVHYSTCDEGCRHRGPVRVKGQEDEEYVFLDVSLGDGTWVSDYHADPWCRDPYAVTGVQGHQVEASWRQVDVRCLSWPQVLLPEALAVLCLRCWAAR